MFYEEGIILGVLCFRTSPQAAFKAMPIAMIQEKYLALKEELRLSNLALDEAQNIITAEVNIGLG